MWLLSREPDDRPSATQARDALAVVVPAVDAGSAPLAATVPVRSAASVPPAPPGSPTLSDVPRPGRPAPHGAAPPQLVARAARSARRTGGGRRCHRGDPRPAAAQAPRPAAAPRQPSPATSATGRPCAELRAERLHARTRHHHPGTRATTAPDRGARVDRCRRVRPELLRAAARQPERRVAAARARRRRARPARAGRPGTTASTGEHAVGEPAERAPDRRQHRRGHGGVRPPRRRYLSEPYRFVTGTGSDGQPIIQSFSRLYGAGQAVCSLELQQVCGHPPHHLADEHHPVVGAVHLVALVLEQQEPGRRAALAQRATTCSASTSGTFVSCAPCTTSSGTVMRSTRCSGDSSRSSAASVCGSPYLVVAAAAIHGSVSCVERGEVGDAAHVDADGEQLREPGQRRERRGSRRRTGPDTPTRAGSASAGVDQEVDGRAHVGDRDEPAVEVVGGGEACARSRPSRARSARRPRRPSASSAWNSGWNVGRSCASGPPCSQISVGSGPSAPRGPEQPARQPQPVLGAELVECRAPRALRRTASAPNCLEGRSSGVATSAHGRARSGEIRGGTVGPSLAISSALPSRVNAAPVTTSPGTGTAGSSMPGAQVEQLHLAAPVDVPDQRGAHACRVERDQVEVVVGALGDGVDGGYTGSLPRSVTASSAGRSRPASVCT